MSKIHFKDTDALQSLLTTEFSDWSDSVTIDQKIINDFADLTGDHQWIHVDVERAKKESPFGGPVAHGFLTLSLQPAMAGGSNFLEQIDGWSNIINYGSNKLRFTGAVPVDSAIHQRARVKSIDVQEHKTVITVETNIHVVGQDERPACVYEMMLVLM
jgi:acyl dehydratase